MESLFLFPKRLNKLTGPVNIGNKVWHNALISGVESLCFQVNKAWAMAAPTFRNCQMIFERWLGATLTPSVNRLGVTIGWKRTDERRTRVWKWKKKKGNKKHVSMFTIREIGLILSLILALESRENYRKGQTKWNWLIYFIGKNVPNFTFCSIWKNIQIQMWYTFFKSLLMLHMPMIHT